MFGPSGSSGTSSAGDLDPTTADGFLETTEDALLVVQATRQGMCQRITRRLLQKEQHYVRSGAIFVYDEEEAGVRLHTQCNALCRSGSPTGFFTDLRCGPE